MTETPAPYGAPKPQPEAGPSEVDRLADQLWGLLGPDMGPDQWREAVRQLADPTQALPVVTPTQAMAFVDAALDWESFGEEAGAPKSRHLFTHLQAVLGHNEVPGPATFWQAKHARNVSPRRRVARLLNYLESVVAVLRRECKLDGQCDGEATS